MKQISRLISVLILLAFVLAACAPAATPTQAPAAQPTSAPAVQPTPAPQVKPTEAPVKPTEAPQADCPAGPSAYGCPGRRHPPDHHRRLGPARPGRPG